ncbi:hypothetical protein JTB14_019312 [Gonioctena quinquepunctata]|nr:hypothetical protein JTB14_019312 [Gonioctena quinquepunctata]
MSSVVIEREETLAALIVETLTQLDTNSDTSNVGGRDPADCSLDFKVIRRRKVLGEESRNPANCSSDFKGAGGHKTQGMNRGYCDGSPDSMIMWKLRTFGTRGSVAVRSIGTSFLRRTQKTTIDHRMPKDLCR